MTCGAGILPPRERRGSGTVGRREELPTSDFTSGRGIALGGSQLARHAVIGWLSTGHLGILRIYQRLTWATASFFGINGESQRLQRMPSAFSHGVITIVAATTMMPVEN